MDQPVGNPQWKPSLNPSSPNTISSRIQANIAAIKLVKDLDGAPATSSQQSVLAQYSGWGGLSAVFDERNAKYESYRAQLQTLLSEEEYKSARRSVINAHYTHPEYVQAVWSAVESYGFNGGRVLEIIIPKWIQEIRKQIGGTMYCVRVHFNEDAKETMKDKIKRMLENDVKASQNTA